MADIKAAAAAHDDDVRFVVTDSVAHDLEIQEKQQQPPQKSKRVASLDIFRGLAVAVLSLSLSLGF